MSVVLVVEDSAPLGRLLRQTLERAGHRARWASSGAEALGHVADEMPDVVMVDLHLADMPGPDLAAKLRTVAPDARIIGVSGEAPPQPVVDQFDAFLLKPVALDTLLVAIRNN